MNYIRIIDAAPVGDLLTAHQVRALHPNVSFSADFSPPDGYEPVYPTPQPAYNPVTHAISEGAPELDGSRWEQRWVITPLAPEVVQANTDRIEAQRIDALWQAAHAYEFAQVSGSAIGLLAMGVMMGKPKCLAVQGWIKSIWTEYYTRKALGSDDTDFSIAGDIPHSVPELMAELGL